MFGYGNYDLAIGNLEKALTSKEYIASDRFSAADLFIGAGTTANVLVSLELGLMLDYEVLP